MIHGLGSYCDKVTANAKTNTTLTITAMLIRVSMMLINDHSIKIHELKRN